ncbi:putative isoleucine--tRNA ligase [Helianthus annuus]|uniref:Isoleucine--tRNA ligase n=1 Tax=Helianthus annuus TaxID=4232 RepID=A0A9K3EJ90_HELAN|nr:putative isoleucine--tRNA ligase [Helianthus annuus]KAJ0477612.1 putative isoleucine--tRNA ligase [Helianthus annuus]KAJ0482133.1 putative isoleucine--tRNA ligase [Helianthus annuus]KAJ0498443.1 putative isoleucine--tRNA ligase [Helianthus annuus]KAJ0664456.1 putative isoleucine--tRNA ligase [Helianthus annuus]
MSDIYRKLRGTLRFLLGNLHDWKAENAIEYDELLEIDQHALFQLESVVKNIKESYESYQFFKILSKFLYRQLSLLKFLNNPHSSSHRSPKKLPRNMNFRLDRGRLYTS